MEKVSRLLSMDGLAQARIQGQPAGFVEIGLSAIRQDCLYSAFIQKLLRVSRASTHHKYEQSYG